MGFVYQLPWQSGSGGNPLRLIINDWQLNGVAAMFSGRPFSVTGSNADLDTRRTSRSANQVGDLTLVNEIGGSGLLLRPAGLCRPALKTVGNTERNQFYGPGGFNLDASIFRSFPIGGARRIEFRLEAAT
jgi:hypothetical protein